MDEEFKLNIELTLTQDQINDWLEDLADIEADYAIPGRASLYDALVNAASAAGADI